MASPRRRRPSTAHRGVDTVSTHPPLRALDGRCDVSRTELRHSGKQHAHAPPDRVASTQARGTCWASASGAPTWAFPAFTPAVLAASTVNCSALSSSIAPLDLASAVAAYLELRHDRCTLADWLGQPSLHTPCRLRSVIGYAHAVASLATGRLPHPLVFFAALARSQCPLHPACCARPC